MDSNRARDRSRSRDRAPPPRRRVDFAALNAAIKSARSAGELRELGRARGADFTAMQHVMICTACTRFRGDDIESAVVCALAARAWLRFDRGSSGRDARSAATAYYAVAKVRMHRAKLPADVAARIDVGALIEDVGREASEMSENLTRRVRPTVYGRLRRWVCAMTRSWVR